MTVVRRTASAHIVRNPGILSGEPIVEGTRVAVRVVVLAWRIAHQDMRRLLRSYPILNEAAVRAALDYYAAHREEIDWYIEANDYDLD